MNEKNFTTESITNQNSIEEITKEAASAIENRIEQLQSGNRAQRRASMKKFGKTRGAISETAKKFAYINLIQKLRELNKKKENENYETTTKNS